MKSKHPASQTFELGDLVVALYPRPSESSYGVLTEVQRSYYPSNDIICDRWKVVWSNEEWSWEANTFIKKAIDVS